MSIPSNQNPPPGHQSENSPGYYKLNEGGKKIIIQKTAKKESSKNSAYTFLESVRTNIDKLEDNGDILTCVDEVFKNYMKKYEGSFAKSFHRFLYFFNLGPKEPERVKNIKELYEAVVNSLYSPKPKHDDEELKMIRRIEGFLLSKPDSAMSEQISNCIQTLCWQLPKEERTIILNRLDQELSPSTYLFDAIQCYESTFRAAPTGQDRLQLLNLLFAERDHVSMLMDKNQQMYSPANGYQSYPRVIPALHARLNTFPWEERSSFFSELEKYRLDGKKFTELLDILDLFPNGESYTVLKAISPFLQSASAHVEPILDVLSAETPLSKILKLLPEATRLNQLMALVPYLSQDFSANNSILEEISYVLNVIAPELREAVFKKLISEPSTLIGKTRSNVHFHS